MAFPHDGTDYGGALRINDHLLLPIDEEGEEYQELRAAQNALDTLKFERIDIYRWPE